MDHESHWVTDTPEAPQLPILVTGCSGYVGSALLGVLQDAHFQGRIDLLDRVSPETHVLRGLDTHFCEVDLTNLEELDATFSKIWTDNSSPSVIIHLAGLFVKDFSLRSTVNSDDYVRENLSGTRNLLHAAINYGAASRIVFLSTALADASSTGELLYHLDPYGYSKLRAEELLLGNGHVPAVVLRSARIVGLPRLREPRTRRLDPSMSRKLASCFVQLRKEKQIPQDIVSDLLESGLSRYLSREPVFVNNSNNKRSYVHVDDATKALFLACIESGILGNTYAVTTNVPISLADIAETCQSELARCGIQVPVKTENSSNPDVVFPTSEWLPGWSPRLATSAQVIAQSAIQYLETVIRDAEGS